MKMKKIIAMSVLLLLCTGVLCSCGRRQNAYNNGKMSISTENSETDVSGTGSTGETELSDTGSADAANLSEVGDAGEVEDTESQKEANPNAIVKNNSTYDCDIEADKAAYDGHVDITVGDNYYATQINDWYMYFDQYEGQVVEIEGYYIGEFAPYDFIGRYGPTCPYCQGGYVSFEILSEEDLSMYQSETDWIKVTGILRQGTDSACGPFYYIEVLKLEKMDEVGLDTVTN